MNASVSVAVVGATGYGGAELVGILHDHPTFSLDYLTSQTYSGEDFGDVHPRFSDRIDATCELLEQDRLPEHDLVFFALPHGESMNYVKEIDLATTRVVDLAADYRLSSPELFESTYNLKHEDPDGLDEAVFGLTEYFSDLIADAELVACPGCYVTSSLIPLYPLVGEDLLTAPIFIDAKSGVSGAGRSPTTANTFVNCNDTIRPYNVAEHRHAEEIKQTLERTGGAPPEFSFVPHVNAMDHGIESAIYAKASNQEQTTDIQERVQELTERHELFRYFDEPPGVKSVVKTPYCDLSVTVDDDRVIVFSYLDNLWKGAASQAVQNANLMFDRPHTEGLV